MVKTVLTVKGSWVQSLVGELDPTSHSMAKNLKNENKSISSGGFQRRGL